MSDSTTRQCSFPSWSWVGWIGPVTPAAADPWKAELVTFFFVDNDVEVQMVRDEDADLARPRPQNVVADSSCLSTGLKLESGADSAGLAKFA